MDKVIDLRSDTLTRPTPEMMHAIQQAEAELGDDVYGEDIATRKLEEYAAELLGKEDALLLPSGTMGNVVGILTHTQRRRSEMIVESRSHIYCSEGGGYAHFGGVSARALDSVNGALDPEKVEDAIRDPANLHHPRTALICMENTHNYSGGAVISLPQIEAVQAVAKRHDLPMHLDGARIFNAAVALHVPASSIAAPFDSVQLCLSKGLSAPVGSLLCGRRDYIREARHYRKMLGGGMRQCGIIAAAGMVALTTMPQRLQEDHDNAKLLANGLAQISGLALDPTAVQTNIVIVDTKALGEEAFTLRQVLSREGVLCITTGRWSLRFVLHRHISAADVQAALPRIAGAVASLREAR